MTPAQAYQTVTNQFNDASGNFVSADEVYNYLWLAECELNKKIQCAEVVDTSIVTVPGTQEYAVPAGFSYISRIIWYNYRLKKIDFRGIEAMDVYYGQQSTGNAWYYYRFGSNIGLYPTPTAAQTIRIYGIQTPAYLTSASTAFTIPDLFHAYLIDYALWRIYAKDQDIGRTQFYTAQWNANLVKAETEWAKFKQNDSIAFVKDIDSYPDSDFGMV